MRTLIFGCGYLGQRVAARLLESGDTVTAVTRSEHRAAQLRRLGIEPIVADIMQPDSLTCLPDVDEVLYCVGFDRTSDHSKRDTYVGGLTNVLAALPTNSRISYVSSTSVYGQAKGEWVDEESETSPASDGGKICLDAEGLLANHNACIVRLAGIYGPGRVLRKVEAVQKCEPIAGNPDSYLNLIHAADAGQLVHHLLTRRDRAPIYLGCDGQPVTRREFYNELAVTLDAPKPVFDATLPTRHGSGGINKRCRSRLLDGLPLEFQYPSFQPGLRASIAG